ncbi:MAG: cell division protein ZapA [Hyphomicrobium sp.]
MAQVAIAFGQRSYRFACSEAEAAHLRKLSAYLTETLDRLVGEHGAIGDERLLVMAALTLADELFTARADIDDLLDDQSEKPEPASDDPDKDTPTLPLKSTFRKGGLG